MWKLVITIIFLTSSTIESVRQCETWGDYANPLPNDHCQISEVAKKNVTELFWSWGYTAEEYYVTTKDGNILFMVRAYKNKRKKTPILLGHGIGMDCGGFALREEKSLAFRLPLLGYEIWLLTFRGSRNSMGHTYLSNRFYPYWDFSLDNFINNDFPTAVEKVYKVTGNKMKYIGYSLGATAALGAAAANPIFVRSRITSIFGLSPIVYIYNAKSILKYLAPFMPIIMAIDKYIFQGHLFFWIPLSAPLCSINPCTMRICSTILGPIFGENWDGADPWTLPVFFTKYSSMFAVKILNHIFQFYKSGIFRQYDYGDENLVRYGQLTPPEYDLTKVPVPVSLYSADNDYVITPSSCEKIKSRVEVQSCCNHHVIANNKFSYLDFTESRYIESELFAVLFPELEILDKCVL